jgi:RNA polymerase sigma factor (sigma-70 family)
MTQGFRKDAVGHVAVVVRTARAARDVASEADLIAVADPVRRAVRSRLSTGSSRSDRPIDPEDVVQETLARVWAARWRLERPVLLPYGLAVARNLVTSAERAAEVRRRHDPRLVDGAPDGDPALAVMAAEEHAAVNRAVAALREDDRRLLMEHEVAGVEARAIAARSGLPAGTVAARLARARARLRVEHLLSLRRVTLPTARCRGVLDAISLGDRRRQRTLLAAEHLAGCATCADLAEPLLTRRRSLTGLMPVLLLPMWLWQWIRAHPVSSSAAVGVGAAGVAVAVAVSGQSPAPAPPPPAPTTVAAAAPSGPVAPSSPATLTVAGVEVLPAGPVGAMARMVGRPAAARDVRVQSVPADEGFWVGTGPGQRVWVQLRPGRESAVRVRPGQLASFPATVVRVSAGTPARIGLSAAEGSAELVAAGAYLEVDPRRLVLR